MQLISFGINEKLDASFALLRLLKLVRLSKVNASPHQPPTTLSASQEQREQDFLTKCRSVGQTTSSSISQQAAARTRQSRYGSMSRQSSSRRSIANLVNGSPRRSSSTLANGAAEGEMIDPDQLV